jgi:hypothetical protein
MSGKFDFVLVTVEHDGARARRLPYRRFLIIESFENSACRVGTMVVKTDLESFKQEFKLSSEQIRLT